MKNNELLFIGYCQNKPKKIVYQDMNEAAEALLKGKQIEVHTYAYNIKNLREILGLDICS